MPQSASRFKMGVHRQLEARYTGAGGQVACESLGRVGGPQTVALPPEGPMLAPESPSRRTLPHPRPGQGIPGHNRLPHQPLAQTLEAVGEPYARPSPIGAPRGPETREASKTSPSQMPRTEGRARTTPEKERSTIPGRICQALRWRTTRNQSALGLPGEAWRVPIGGACPSGGRGRSQTGPTPGPASHRFSHVLMRRSSARPQNQPRRHPDQEYCAGQKSRRWAGFEGVRVRVGKPPHKSARVYVGSFRVIQSCRSLVVWD
jgi:hypothetical protein